jgi:hypothetical protein
MVTQVSQGLQQLASDLFRASRYKHCHRHHNLSHAVQGVLAVGASTEETL